MNETTTPHLSSEDLTWIATMLGMTPEELFDSPTTQAVLKWILDPERAPSYYGDDASLLCCNGIGAVAIELDSYLEDCEAEYFGGFTAAWLADILDLPIELIEWIQDHEGYAPLGKAVQQNADAIWILRNRLMGGNPRACKAGEVLAFYDGKCHMREIPSCSSSPFYFFRR